MIPSDVDGAAEEGTVRSSPDPSVFIRGELNPEPQKLSDTQPLACRGVSPAEQARDRGLHIEITLSENRAKRKKAEIPAGVLMAAPDRLAPACAGTRANVAEASGKLGV
jgi:hypothetical protein